MGVGGAVLSCPVSHAFPSGQVHKTSAIDVTEVKPLPFPSTKILEINMEKYGVQEDEDKTKTASANDRCPKCGEKLTQEGTVNVKHCPSCGTLPFEESPPSTPSSDP